jgi:hypothetical protein
VSSVDNLRRRLHLTYDMCFVSLGRESRRKSGRRRGVRSVKKRACQSSVHGERTSRRYQHYEHSQQAAFSCFPKDPGPFSSRGLARRSIPNLDSAHFMSYINILEKAEATIALDLYPATLIITQQSWSPQLPPSSLQ